MQSYIFIFYCGYVQDSSSLFDCIFPTFYNSKRSRRIINNNEHFCSNLLLDNSVSKPYFSSLFPPHSLTTMPRPGSLVAEKSSTVTDTEDNSGSSQVIDDRAMFMISVEFSGITHRPNVTSNGQHLSEGTSSTARQSNMKPLAS